MSTSISELKTQFMTLYDNATQYFQDQLELMREKTQELSMKEPLKGFYSVEVNRIERFIPDVAATGK